MLSLILSRFFFFAFALTAIAGLANIIGQVILRPIEFKTGKGGRMSFGKPGITATANWVTGTERNAPDTTINFQEKDNEGRIRTSGGASLNVNDFYDGRKDLKRILDESKRRGTQMILDTQISLIGQVNWNDNSVSIDSFPADDKAAERNSSLRPYNTINPIFQEGGKEEKFRIMPSNSFQHLWFILFEVLKTLCIAMLFFTLSRLFKKFYNRIFFTGGNVFLLRKAGLYLLLPQVASIPVYWFFLKNIYPVKFFASFPQSNKFEMVSQYSFASGINWQFVFLGMAMLILGYIFKDGLKLKEDNDLTV